MAVRVLVVEDDDLVRMIAVEALREEGFEVTEFENGDKAAGLLVDPDGYQALFTDVRMPGSMDGVDIALFARTLDPNIAVIVASGFARNLVSRLEDLDPPMAFFPKPYRPKEVISTLRRFTE